MRVSKILSFCMLFGLIVNICAENLSVQEHRNWPRDTEEVCGISYDADRIVGGSNAGLGQFPWQARIGYMTKSASLQLARTYLTIMNTILRFLWSFSLIAWCLLAIFRTTKWQDLRRETWSIQLWRYINFTTTCSNGSPLLATEQYRDVSVANMASICGYWFVRFNHRSSVQLGELITNTDLDCDDYECSDHVQVFKPVEIHYSDSYSGPPKYKDDIGTIKLDRDAIITGMFHQKSARIGVICVIYRLGASHLLAVR